MDGTAKETDHVPQRIEIFDMAHLVGEHLDGLLGPGRQGQGDIGPEHAHQAGAGQGIGKENGHGLHLPLRAQGFILILELAADFLDTPGAQIPPEAHVGKGKPQQHRDDAQQIHLGQGDRNGSVFDAYGKVFHPVAQGNVIGVP